MRQTRYEQPMDNVNRRRMRLLPTEEALGAPEVDFVEKVIEDWFQAPST